MKRGLVLGKFAPLHRGHQTLIEASLAAMDETIVLVYEARIVSRIPLEVRAGWIRQLYPQVRVIEGHNAPEETGHEPVIMKLQDDYVRRMMPASITHFFSSEWYGEHVSRALGAVNVQVDPNRERVPITGTSLRQDPFAHRRYVTPVVYRDLVRWIVLLGAESTGKSTLAAGLAKTCDTTWLPEYGREYWETHRADDGTLTPDQLVELARGHREREDRAVLEARRLFFVDTDARITRNYSRWYHRGRVRPELMAMADEAIGRYHLAILCGDDIPYSEDGTRAGEKRRREAQEEIRAELKVAGAPWLEVTGSVPERIAAVRQAITHFRLDAWC